jgi:hypothetical protein
MALSYMHIGFHVTYHSHILLKLEFCRQIFPRILKYQNFMKIRSVRAELLREHWTKRAEYTQTD